MSNLVAKDWQGMVGQIVPNFQKALIFALWGALGGAVGNLIGELVQLNKPGGTPNELAVRVAIWFGIIGIGIGVAILLGYYQYLKRGFLIVDALKLGAPVGFIAGAVSGAIAQSMFSALGAGEVLRVICWAIAGGLLGLGLSFRIPNLGKLYGFLGGAAGGVIGGILFIVFSMTFQMADALGRFAGIAAIGFFIGLMLVLVEAALREAWLEVRYGPKEVRNISLGSEPVTIGGDPNACTVYARNTPAVAFRYKLDGGRITCEDVAKGQVTTVQPGNSRVIGNLTITVGGAGAAAQAAPAAAPQPAARPSGGFSLRLSTGKVISLADGAKISASDVPGLQSSIGGAVAEVNRNPNDPSILGLKNLSRSAWSVTLANRDRMQVDPGRSIRLQGGTKISFGSVSADIEMT
jgi:hypothetical protein